MNADFKGLLDRSGWSQAKAADKLGKSPGVISQYLKGTTRPSETVLRLFKSILAHDQPQVLGPRGRKAYPKHQEDAVQLREAISDIDDLEVTATKILDQARRAKARLATMSAEPPDPNSGDAEEIKRIVEATSKAVDEHLEKALEENEHSSQRHLPSFAASPHSTKKT